MSADQRVVPMQSVERVSGVLLTFATHGPVQKLSDIARTLGLPKSAVHRILDSLVHTGLVVREPDSARYRLGPRAVDLAMAAMGTPDVAAIAAPFMRDLVERTAETATLSLLVGNESAYAAQVVGPQDVRMTVEVGRRSPLYAGASGRSILAHLPAEALDRYLSETRLERLTPRTITEPSSLRARLEQVRRDGYAVSDGELDPAAGALAAPILTQSDRVVGALCVCGPVSRFTADKVAEYAPLVKVASAELTRRLP